MDLDKNKTWKKGFAQHPWHGALLRVPTQQPVPTVPSSPGVLLRHLGGTSEAEGGELRMVEAILGAEQGKWLEVSPEQLGKANPQPTATAPAALS